MIALVSQGIRIKSLAFQCIKTNMNSETGLKEAIGSHCALCAHSQHLYRPSHAVFTWCSGHHISCLNEAAYVEIHMCNSTYIHM